MNKNNIKKTKNAVKKATEKTLKNKKQATIIFVALLLILLVGAIAVGYYYLRNKPNGANVNSELSIHFLELGNNYTGDSIYIKSGDTDILVDAGSRTNSSTSISNYVNKYVTDGKLEYIIATHADQDHIAGFAGDNTNSSIFDLYEVETIIDFPKTNKTTQVYNRYVSKREIEVENGAKHYTALECYNEINGAKRNYVLSDNVTLTILYNYYYDNYSSDENNYSVCFMITNGSNTYLFTGDLEKQGEQKLVENNNLTNVTLYKAGHHGSKTSSNDVLLDVIKPKICVVTCVAGSVEYTDNLLNTFPTQGFINRISKWTKEVYVTTLGTIEENGINADETIHYKTTRHLSFNGNIIIASVNGEVSVSCSNNNKRLYETEWFVQNRQMPNGWAP